MTAAIRKAIIFFAFLGCFLFIAESVFAQLTVYSGRNRALIEPLVDRFQAETGITVRVRYGGTTQLAVAILEEGRRSPADVFWSQDAGALGALHNGNMLRVLPDSITQALPPQFRNSARTWVSTSARARILAYDANRISADELPSSVYELTDPKWRGKVGWAPTNASFQSFVTAMRALDGEEKTRQWLLDMRRNGAIAYNNNNSILQAIEAGEVLVGLTNHYYVDRAMATNPGYPIRFAFFETGDTGNLINVAGLGIVAPSRRVEQATRFIHFMMQEEAQQFFRDATFEYPVTTGLEQGYRMIEDVLELAPDIDLDLLEDLDGTLRLLRQTGLL